MSTKFYKTQTGTYLGLNKEQRFTVSFGKRIDGTFFFSQETIPVEVVEQIEQTIKGAILTDVSFATAEVSQEQIEQVLITIKQLGTLIS